MMYDILNKKKQAKELTTHEINAVIQSLDKVPDYQISALLMAICINGMTPRETADLTMAMANSGEMLDLSSIKGKTLDKHSTGGVGDKTTFIVAPIMAALGFPMGKMSGRGLGHTGGTIDKLESIPGFNTNLSTHDFINITKKHGLCISAQTGNLAPADKKIYALRDTTATVDSIPLIAASIMSKKLAAGAEYILLDVKTGSGAFMQNVSDARELAKAMVDIGNSCGRKTAAIITDMSAPLGNTIGNSLEIEEAIKLLKGDKNIPDDLWEISISLSAHLLHMAEGIPLTECHTKAEEVIKNGKALKKFADMVEAQGGDRNYIEGEKTIPYKSVVPIISSCNGYVGAIDTAGVGLAAMKLGAGRQKMTDTICYESGIVMSVKLGDYVEKGQTMATLYSNLHNNVDDAEVKMLNSITINKIKPSIPPLIYETIGL